MPIATRRCSKLPAYGGDAVGRWHLSLRVDLTARSRLRLVNTRNAAKVLGHDKYWNEAFLAGYLECCANGLESNAEAAYEFLSFAPKLAQRVFGVGRMPGISILSEEVRAQALLAGACVRTDRRIEAEAAVKLAAELSESSDALPYAEAERALREAELHGESSGFHFACKAVRLFREAGDADSLAWSYLVRGRTRTDQAAALDWLWALELAALNTPRGLQTYEATLKELFGVVDSKALLPENLDAMYLRLRGIGARWRRHSNASRLKMHTYWLHGRSMLAMQFPRPARRRLARARKGIRRSGNAVDLALVSLDLSRALAQEQSECLGALADDTLSQIREEEHEELRSDLEPWLSEPGSESVTQEVTQTIRDRAASKLDVSAAKSTALECIALRGFGRCI